MHSLLSVALIGSAALLIDDEAEQQAVAALGKLGASSCEMTLGKGSLLLTFA